MAEELDRLAEKLRRPAKSLGPFARLALDDLRQLSDAIDQALERQRRALDQAVEQAIPRPLRAIVLRALRGGGPK